jgi:Flp pilus assembly protein TadD
MKKDIVTVALALALASCSTSQKQKMYSADSINKSTAPLELETSSTF